MMKTLINSVLMIAILACVSTAQFSSVPPARKTWGPMSNGLRMSVVYGLSDLRLFVEVRNFSAKPVCICRPEVNNLSFQARRGPKDKWRDLKFKLPPEEVVVLPVCITHRLQPTAKKRPPGRELTRNPWEETMMYSADLADYAFPGGWASAQVRVVQHNVYCGNTRNKVGTVRSSVFGVKLPLEAAITPMVVPAHLP